MLQLLQTRTVVDCDTMDIDVPKALGPFVDCTSNQAIAYFELQKPENKTLVKLSVVLTESLQPLYPDISPKQLAVEVAMVKLQLGVSKYVTGFVHVQTNTYFAYDTEKTVRNANRIVELFKILDSSFDTSRVCIKIPATWEGLQACRTLQASGIATLATTLFTMTQVSLAGEVGCRYVAPYVNELKVHFEPGFIDHNKAQALCLEAQTYYKSHGLKTQVLPASLTSIDEIMALAGVDHITIAPALLQELATTPASALATKSLFDGEAEAVPIATRVFGIDEAGYRIAFTRSANGEGERKLTQAINIFCDMQDKIEVMMEAIQAAA